MVNNLKFFSRSRRHLIEQEGCRALFKGLAPNLVGVAPTRALYFCTYSTAKRKLNQIMAPDSHLVHMYSAGLAGKNPLPLLLCLLKSRCSYDPVPIFSFVQSLLVFFLSRRQEARRARDCLVTGRGRGWGCPCVCSSFSPVMTCF